MELEQTLQELCDDLFAIDTAVVDADAILHSLAALARRFPVAQRRLGRLLGATSAAVRRDLRAPTRFAELATRFLYRCETARSALALLAMLASNNVLNQQRIVRSVAGVVIDATAAALSETPDAVRTTVFAAGKIKKTTTARRRCRLFALTVPDAVKREFQRWRRRQQALQHHRIPSGVAPERGGVPRPCLCNDCLGREQFLPTWQLHFQDLGRWVIDSDDQESGASALAAQTPALSTRAFFQVFLQDYRICALDDSVALDDRSDALPEAEATKRTSTLFYFVRRDASDSAFDPLQHVSALEIAADVDVPDASQGQVVDTETRATDDTSAAYEAVEHVLLFQGRTEIAACAHRHARAQCRDVGPEVQTCSERIARFVRAIDAADSAGCVSVRRITTALSEDEADEQAQLLPIDRHVLTCVLRFLDSDSDSVAIAALCGVQRQAEGDPSARDEPNASTSEASEVDERSDDLTPRDASVQIFANVATQELLVRCAYEEHDEDSDRTRIAVFSVTIPHERLESQRSSDATSVDPLALLCVTDEALDAMLTRCRLCECALDLLETEAEADELLYLRRDGSSDDGSREDEDTDDQPDAHSPAQSPQPSPLDKTRAAPTTTQSVPGLSSDLAAALAKLQSLVETARASDSSASKTSRAFASKFHATLASLISRCNARVTALASANTVGVPEAHRRAGIERCRSCRDVLIELGKRVRLALEPSTPSATSKADSAPLSPEMLARIAKLVRKSLARVEAVSARVDAWETPDARVEKLELSRRVWASGFPDPEFYREREAQTRANQSTQRQLSRLLVQKTQKRTTAS